PRIRGIERNRLAQKFFGRAEGFATPLRPHHVLGAQNEVISLNFFGLLAGGRPGLVNVNDTKIAGYLGDDLADDLVLDEEDVGHLAIEPVGPNVGAGLGLNELRHDAEAVVGAPDATLEYVGAPSSRPSLGISTALPLY